MFYLLHRGLLFAVLAVPPSSAPDGIRDRIHAALANPHIALALLAIGFLGICAEALSPGRILPGVIGAACAALSLSSLLTTLRGGIGVGLMAVALGLLAWGARTTLRLIPSMVAAAIMLAALHVADPAINSAAAIAASVSLCLAAGFLFSVASVARRAKRDTRAVILKKNNKKEQ